MNNVLLVRRAGSRFYERTQNRERWLTFATEAPDEVAGFGGLQSIDEVRWGPQASTRLLASDTPTEVITYVRAGRLIRRDAEDRSSIFDAGSFERVRPGPDWACSELNPSSTHFVHFFRISLRSPLPAVEDQVECLRFSEGERKQRMLLVASQGGGPVTLTLTQDASVFSMLLYPGQQAARTLHPGRCAWFHVVHGSVSLGDLVLERGDGVGIGGGSLSVAAREHSEVLVVELPHPPGMRHLESDEL